MTDNRPIRRLTELGTVVLPKEFRKALGIRAFDSLSFELKDNTILVTKYEPDSTSYRCIKCGLVFSVPNSEPFRGCDHCANLVADRISDRIASYPGPAFQKAIKESPESTCYTELLSTLDSHYKAGLTHNQIIDTLVKLTYVYTKDALVTEIQELLDLGKEHGIDSICTLDRIESILP